MTTTEEIREGYTQWSITDEGAHAAGEEFDEWLAEHDRIVKAAVLYEAAEWFESRATSDPGTAWFNNDAAKAIRANADLFAQA